MKHQELVETVRKIREKILEVEKSEISIGETDTRQGLINPLFQALGWDFTDFTHVKSEHRHAKYNEPVDYAFFSRQQKERPVLLLEAKSLGTNLDGPKAVKQLCSYLGEMGVQWGVLSDGNKYVMYNSKAGASFDDQRFLTLQIKDVDTEDGLSAEEFSEKIYALLSRDCLENDEVQNTYETHMIDAQIEDALFSLFSTPFDTLANAIRREFKEERVRANPGLRVTTKQIVSFLENMADEDGRLPIDTVEQIKTSDDELLNSVSESEAGELSNSLDGMKRAKRILISDLLEDKLVSEGDNWKFEYKGVVSWGRVTGNGELEINSEIFPNPSKAGAHLKGGKPCAGWNAWQFKKEDGTWGSIEGLRAIYREKHNIRAIKKGHNRDQKVAA